MKKLKSGAEEALARVVSRNMRAVRSELQWTVGDAAGRMGIAPREWEELESGKVKLSLALVEVIAEALGVDAAVLLPEDEAVVEAAADRGGEAWQEPIPRSRRTAKASVGRGGGPEASLLREIRGSGGPGSGSRGGCQADSGRDRRRRWPWGQPDPERQRGSGRAAGGSTRICAVCLMRRGCARRSSRASRA